jgi:hypothetical protein
MISLWQLRKTGRRRARSPQWHGSVSSGLAVSSGPGAAYLGGNEVFRVDYQVCHRCRLGWVEQPSTVAEYRRCGLATAALAALRSENPEIEWHTLGGHLADSVPFWVSAGAGIPGGYTQRDPCPHRGAG